MNQHVSKRSVIAMLCTVVFFIVCAFTFQNGVPIISPISPAEISPPVFDDLRVPLDRAKAVGQPSDADFDPFIGNTYAYTFDPGTDEMLYFSAQIPHNYKYGTNIEAHIHWAPSTTNTGTVMWCLDCYLAEWNGTFGALTTLCQEQAGDGTAYKHQLCELGSISGAAIDTLSAMLVCRIYRDANHLTLDTYTGDAYGIEVDFHYQIDSFGSATENSKW